MPKAILTPDEHAAINELKSAYVAVMKCVHPGETYAADTAMLHGHLVAVQNAILSQAAARAYPNLYRLLGV